MTSFERAVKVAIDSREPCDVSLMLRLSIGEEMQPLESSANSSFFIL